MKCKNYREMVSRYLDGDLSANEEFLLKSHLKDCDSCNEHFLQLKLLKEKLNSLTVLVPSESFEASLHDRIYSEENNKVGFFENFTMMFDSKKLTLALSTAILLFVVSFFSIRIITADTQKTENNNLITSEKSEVKKQGTIASPESGYIPVANESKWNVIIMSNDKKIKSYVLNDENKSSVRIKRFINDLEKEAVYLKK